MATSSVQSKADRNDPAILNERMKHLKDMATTASIQKEANLFHAKQLSWWSRSLSWMGALLLAPVPAVAANCARRPLVIVFTSMASGAAVFGYAWYLITPTVDARTSAMRWDHFNHEAWRRIKSLSAKSQAELPFSLPFAENDLGCDYDRLVAEFSCHNERALEHARLQNTRDKLHSMGIRTSG